MKNKLATFIDSHDLTQADAATRLGVSVKTIYNNMEGPVSGSLSKQIDITTEDMRRERVAELAKELNELCSEG
jgi:DNA-binding XRE family transcriptional regulator